MKNALFLLVLLVLVLVLPGCASAVDGDSLPPVVEETAADARGLRGVDAPSEEIALDADAAGCDSAELSAVVQDGSYAEFNSLLESSSVNLDSAAIGGSTCSRVCKCCKNNGNRFCCRHCRFCSGPIGVSDGVLAP